MKASLIVATDLSGGIGKDGGIPWRCKRDMKLFRQITMGHTLIMGRKTVETLPKHLDGRVTVRLSSEKVMGIPLVGGLKYDVSATSLEEAAEKAAYHNPGKRVFIAGGQSVYDEVLGLYPENTPFDIDEVHLSVIHGLHGCDMVYFIPDEPEWKVEEVRFHIELKDDPGFSYYKLVRS